MPAKSDVSRVHPIFDWLKENGGPAWPDRLIAISTGTSGIDGGLKGRVHVERERAVAPSAARLAWMIRNANALVPADGRRWQEMTCRLSDVIGREEALSRLERGDTSVSNKFRFEGDSYADCLIECDNIIIWIEGKRFDWISPTTTWDVTRDQLARNIEAASLLAKKADKDYRVLLCHEHPLKRHEEILVQGYRDGHLVGGFPHLSWEQRQEFRTRIGTLKWGRIVEEWPAMRLDPRLEDLGRSLESILYETRHQPVDGRQTSVRRPDVRGASRVMPG